MQMVILIVGVFLIVISCLIGFKLGKRSKSVNIEHMERIQNNEVEEKYCTSCGNKIKNKQKFCENCGEKIAK